MTTTVTVGSFDNVTVTPNIQIVTVKGIQCPAPASLTATTTDGTPNLVGTLSIPGLKAGDKPFSASFSVNGVVTQMGFFGFGTLPELELPTWSNGSDGPPSIASPATSNIEQVVSTDDQTTWSQTAFNGSTTDYSSVTMNLVYLRGLAV